MSDKENVLMRLQNHQCSVQEAMAALDYLYAEKARPLLDACVEVTGCLECMGPGETGKWCSELPGQECPVCRCANAIKEYEKGA